jgi:hypothetical protein
VADWALSGMELAAHGQYDGMPTALRVGERNPLPRLKRPSADTGELHVVRHC